MSESEKKHGGVRAGSGRKTKYAKTVVARVPEQYLETIRALISHLDDTRYIDHHYPQGSTSEPVFLRSLDGKPQHMVFTTKPVPKA
jgi:hypothetical protein